MANDKIHLCQFLCFCRGPRTYMLTHVESSRTWLLASAQAVSLSWTTIRPYGTWLKIKTVQRGKFPVVGFVKDPSGVAALYLEKREGKDLVYMGKARYRLAADRLKSNPKTARYRGEPEGQAHQANQEAKGHVG